MLKGRGRDPRAAMPATPAHLAARPPVQAHLNARPPGQAQRTPYVQPHRAPLAKPEPDYEVVEFPSEQYVNAKLQPPPPPPPRPPTGHPVEAGASCGLCGGGGARVRCSECGRRALCASCDDMYHRHPKRRHHQRQALPLSQLRDDRPPLPPKSNAPVPPPRRHKLSGDRSSASPRPPGLDQRRATLGHLSAMQNPMMMNNTQQIPAHLQKLSQPTAQLGSMPYLPTNMHPAAPVAHSQLQANNMGQLHSNTMGHNMAAWGRQRGSLQGFNMQPNMALPTESWESPESLSPSGHISPWSRPLRRGASVLELGGGGGGAPSCAGCAHCAPVQWRYGSCASLDHQAWPTAAAGWPPHASCCMPHPPHDPHLRHQHLHHSQTPQPYRRADSRAVSRAASRTGSRAGSPAASVRSRASRRTKHRTPSPPPPLPSSDADSESESESDHAPIKPPPKDEDRRPQKEKRKPQVEETRRQEEERRPVPQEEEEGSLGPAPPPPSAAWQCEHCTFVNEPGERVCAVCCRTPTTTAKVVAEVNNAMTRLKVSEKSSPSPARPVPRQQDSHVKQNGEETKARSTKERISTGCGPSPPREEIKPQKITNRLVTPTREQSNDAVEQKRTRHDMGVGPSPPRDNQGTRHSMGTGPSPPRETVATVRPSPYRETKTQPEPPTRHSVSVGPSPPRENTRSSVGTSPLKNSVYKKSAGTSPRETSVERRPSSRANVSTTGTSPPPQSISTQTYEVAVAVGGREREWERAPSASRSRPRRRFGARDDSRRERSHSRHSLSSDTRESDRSARTSGAGRWEWREPRDSSPPEWSGSERRRLTRRASHLDLRRARPVRRASFYGSEAASPEPPSSRTLSLEALAGAGARREAERGLELARLMTEAERLGFSAAEVHAALAQSPAAPLSWLSERWPSLCAGVRAAAARLAPAAPVTELEARAALARHRGAMWPAVTDCVERHRRQTEVVSVGEEGRLRGHVWGSPAGADDDAAPPAPAPASARHPHRLRAEDSSDEFEEPTPTKFHDDDWMYLPLEPVTNSYDIEPEDDVWRRSERRIDPNDNFNGRTDDIANKLKSFLIQAGVPSIDENLLLKGLLADNTTFRSAADSNLTNLNNRQIKPQALDLGQSENDFINAYNALTRSSPLPNITNTNIIETRIEDFSISNQESHNFVVDASATVNKGEKDVKRPETINILDKKPDTKNIPKHQTQNPPAIPSSSSLPSVTDENEPKDEKILVVNKTVPLVNLNEQPISLKINTESIPNEVIADINVITEMEIPRPFVSSDQKASNDLVVAKPNNVQNVAKDIKTEIEIPHSSVTVEPKMSPEPRTQKPESSSIGSKDIMRKQNDNDGEEKTSNLSEIVDTTQRLIQQMKEEINSDINYIDDTSISQSEADNSSNESDFSTEHESSYSETEEETEDITSDEKETSSAEEDDNDIRSGKSATVITRTSSEDNEQFEEAMDHIEEQNESFKQTNIEILDSIAKSLQEEHTISIEINQSNELKEHRPIVAKVQKQDSNNNLFAEVNSFEEIYEQLNSTNVNKNKKTKQPKAQQQSKVVGEPVAMNSIQKQVIVVEKQEIQLTLFKPEAPIKFLVTENQHPIFNATFENIEEPLVIANIEPSIVANVEQPSIMANIEQPLAITNVEEPLVTATIEAPIVIASIEEPMIMATIEEPIVQDSANRSTGTEVTTNNLNASDISDISANVISNSYEDKNDTDNDEDSSQSDSSRTTISPMKENNNQKMNPPNTASPTNLMNKNNTTPVNVVKVPVTTNIEKNDTQIDHITPKAKSKSPEKLTSASPPNDNTYIKNGTTKSNIPKLVKVLPNNKQKGDKTPAKVTTSKVPVRRGSLKQQPAPSPPKAHFGNVLSGHVKQLQTRLFNDKLPKITTKQPEVIEVKASTSSTLNKKRPAPLPPSKRQEKQSSPPKASPTKEKKNNYFRETCRTEDEWTESDSEDSQSQLQIVRPSEEPPRALSPPPPITVRRVSGQLIDLARIRLLEGSPERQARMLLAEGATESWEQAQLAVELVARGTEPPAALLAALECTDLSAALAYLHQDCELCACRLPEHEMVSMLRCTHRCCRECARLYFTVQITERSIADCVCPYCKEPELESLPEDSWLEYFAHLDILLKTLLETDLHELFQRKLRDRTLARDPNFRWCVECSSGFFVHPKQKKLRCPECKSVSCASCRKPWSASHEGLTCEQYAAWLEDNDPERSVAAVQQHLRENGLECPRCHFKYSLSRGGCMHFTCTQCKYEFCYGCGKPFMMGARCGLSEYCAKLGLHAHHPRNCLFYLRDKEPHELQTLLQMNNVKYEIEASSEGAGAGAGSARCPVQLQRETPAGLVDCACGADVLPGHAGLCKNHYLEYLSRLVRARRVDPLPLLGVDDLETLVRRAALRLPPRPYGTLEGLYKRALVEIVKEKIPLD